MEMGALGARLLERCTSQVVETEESAEVVIQKVKNDTSECS